MLTMKICGTDEAGRGPVIGPLVVAGVLVSEEKEAQLKAMGCKDSKLLLPAKREELYEKIIDLADGYKIIIVEPQEIDDALFGHELNLNWLEAHKNIDIIEDLKPDKVIIDSPSNNTVAFKEYLVERLTHKPEMLVEHKADVNHPSVAAASILAKVTRDREIQKICKSLGCDFGSGYPSDPKTKEWLKENFDTHPEIIRKSWASYKKLVANKKQSSLGKF